MDTGGGGILTVCIFMFVTKCQIPFFGVGGRAFLAAFFIWIGAEMSCDKRFVASLINNRIFAFLSFIFVGVGSIYWHTSMPKMTTELVIPYCITAVLGTLGIYAISKWIDNKYANTSIGKFLCFTGNHTLEILTWHLLLFKIVNLLIVCIYNLPEENLAQFPVYVEYARKGWIVLYFIVGCGIPLACCWVYEKIEYNRSKI